MRRETIIQLYTEMMADPKNPPLYKNVSQDECLSASRIIFEYVFFEMFQHKSLAEVCRRITQKCYTDMKLDYVSSFIDFPASADTVAKKIKYVFSVRDFKGNATRDILRDRQFAGASYPKDFFLGEEGKSNLLAVIDYMIRNEFLGRTNDELYEIFVNSTKIKGSLDKYGITKEVTEFYGYPVFALHDMLARHDEESMFLLQSACLNRSFIRKGKNNERNKRQSS